MKCKICNINFKRIRDMEFCEICDQWYCNDDILDHLGNTDHLKRI